MNREKIVGILVCTLLIATTFPVLGMEINNEFVINDFKYSNKEISSEINTPQVSSMIWHEDQNQTENCGMGFSIAPPYWLAQEFKPSKEKLIGVELWIFKSDNPPSGVKITVSIRDSLNGNDLTVATVNADPISASGTWVLFDFKDISVTPENTYYIVCRGNGGSGNNIYCWLFNKFNSYDRGIAWMSINNGSTWDDLENYDPNYPQIDFCFKTYNSKSKTKPFIFNSNILGCLFERLPNNLQIIRQLLGFQ